jgi:hypothetical protein
MLIRELETNEIQIGKSLFSVLRLGRVRSLCYEGRIARLIFVGIVRLRDLASAPAYRRSSPLDLDYLNQRHQLSLFMADNAACDRSRAAHRGLARGYAAAIAGAGFDRRAGCAA